jgi:hypothetical protein
MSRSSSKDEPVVRQMIVLGDVFTCCRKRLIELCEPDFLSRISSEIDQEALPAAMLARQLVNPPLQRLAEAEIIGMQGQNLLAANGIENPVGQLDFDPEQTAIKLVMLAPD